MRFYLSVFCFLLSVTMSAQSVFDENIISGDDLREMITQVFESPDGQALLKADAEYGQDIVLLVHSRHASGLDREDVRNAIIDLKSSPTELRLTFPVRIYDEGEMTPSESSRAIRVGLGRTENILELHLSREDFSAKKRYNLFATFEKKDGVWKLSTQNLKVIP